MAGMSHMLALMSHKQAVGISGICCNSARAANGAHAVDAANGGAEPPGGSCFSVRFGTWFMFIGLSHFANARGDAGVGFGGFRTRWRQVTRPTICVELTFHVFDVVVVRASFLISHDVG